MGVCSKEVTHDSWTRHLYCLGYSSTRFRLAEIFLGVMVEVEAYTELLEIVCA